MNFHPTVHRPWGTYTVLEDSTGYKIKSIEVKPVVLNLIMIEVQSGDYLEENDIVRFDDVYGRA